MVDGEINMSNYEEAEKFRYLILAVQRYGNRILKELLGGVGVTPSQAEVISILKERQPISLKELGELLICEAGSPSRLIDRMVKDALVERVKDENDSRFVRLQLTSLGMGKYEMIVETEMILYQKLTQFYTVDELQFSNGVLSRFLSESPLSNTLLKRGYSIKFEDN